MLREGENPVADPSLPILRSKLAAQEWDFLVAFAAAPEDLQGAAANAGLTPSEASALLKSARGRECISALLSTRDARNAQIRDGIISALYSMGNWDPADAFDENGHLVHPSKLPDRLRVAVTSFTYNPATGAIEYKFESRLKALALLQQWFLSTGAEKPEGSGEDEGRAEWIVRGRKVVVENNG